MSIIYPLHPVEILQLIAQQLDSHDLLACILVCKVWSNSFRPVLWHTVVVSSSGPDFFAPQNQPLLRHIRVLDYRAHPHETLLPTLGFAHLTTLKICPLSLRCVLNDPIALWTNTTAVLHTLSQGPLSTLELSHSTATADFWNAAASCRHLRRLVLKYLDIACDVFQPFWRACHNVETLVLDNAVVYTGGSAIHWNHKRFARLKHIVLEGEDSALPESYVSSLPWLLAPYLETIYCSNKKGILPVDLNSLVAEIRDATQAAREGKAFYVGDGEAQEGGGGGELHLASGNNNASSHPKIEHLLKGLVPGQRVREFMCGNMSPPLYAGDLHKIIRNMAALEKFCVRRLGRRPNIRHELAPLQQHVNTLVELDIWGCPLEHATLVGFLEQCPRLQVFVADCINAAWVTRSRPWVCAGLRKFRVQFHVYNGSNMDTWFDKQQEMLLERLAGLPCLERLYVPEYWYRCGLEHLKGLAHVQDVYFGSSIDELQEADARWMVEQWPELKTVRMPAPSVGTDSRMSVDSARVFEDHGVECLTILYGDCP
ncbi:hypothetical protein BG005_009136 [Podila minutissima]|nr:hypothetical protein BG005_009136 [Podila minutissima]